jgi:4-amino-4-deoxy-L-arabinose transferase-like glycosyltransferase
VAAIFLVAIAIRLAAIAHVGFTTLRFGDARAYLAAAETLVRSGRYPAETDYGSFRAPGYPFFLVLATLGDPRRVGAAKVANAALGGMGAVALAGLSALLFRRRGMAVATGLAAALDPSLVYSAADVQSEPLFLLLLVVAAIFLVVCQDRPSSNAGLLAGGALGLAALTRPSALVLVPLLAAAPFFDRRHPRRVRAHLSASALLGLVLALFPWTVRNLVAYRELLPVNDFAGVAIYLGNSDLMARFYDVRTRAEYDAWIRDLGRVSEAKRAELAAAGRTSPSQRLGFYLSKAIQERRGNPAATLPLFAHKTWDWLRPYPHPLFWPAAVVIGVGIYYTALYLLAARGLAVAPRRGAAAFALVVLGVTLISHVLLIVVWRYRVPYWDPVLLLYAPVGLFRRN